MTAQIDVTYQTGRPSCWRVRRQVGDHSATWTYLHKEDAELMVERMRTWPDDHRPEGWPLAYLYEYEDERGR